MTIHWCECHSVVGDDRAIQGDVVGLSPYLSHESLLRRADYTCSYVSPPRVSGADVNLEYKVVDARPRLYAQYTCHDGLMFKDRSRQFMYCSDRRWIGVLPTCIIGTARYDAVALLLRRRDLTFPLLQSTQLRFFITHHLQNAVQLTDFFMDYCKSQNTEHFQDWISHYVT